jgi:hypothetical protein
MALAIIAVAAMLAMLVALVANTESPTPFVIALPIAWAAALRLDYIYGGISYIFVGGVLVVLAALLAFGIIQSRRKSAAQGNISDGCNIKKPRQFIIKKPREFITALRCDGCAAPLKSYGRNMAYCKNCGLEHLIGG